MFVWRLPLLVRVFTHTVEENRAGWTSRCSLTPTGPDNQAGSSTNGGREAPVFAVSGGAAMEYFGQLLYEETETGKVRLVWLELVW